MITKLFVRYNIYHQHILKLKPYKLNMSYGKTRMFFNVVDALS